MGEWDCGQRWIEMEIVAGVASVGLKYTPHSTVLLFHMIVHEVMRLDVIDVVCVDVGCRAVGSVHCR